MPTFLKVEEEESSKTLNKSLKNIDACIYFKIQKIEKITGWKIILKAKHILNFDNTENATKYATKLKFLSDKKYLIQFIKNLIYNLIHSWF